MRSRGKNQEPNHGVRRAIRRGRAGPSCFFLTVGFLFIVHFGYVFLSRPIDDIPAFVEWPAWWFGPPFFFEQGFFGVAQRLSGWDLVWIGTFGLNQPYLRVGNFLRTKIVSVSEHGC